jgi:D-sedoheptulose 7-phosphate isomerase
MQQHRAGGAMPAFLNILDGFDSMQPTLWDQFIAELSDILRALSVRDASGAEIGGAGLDAWVERTLELSARGGCVYLAGNGASASMASHFSADIAKNAGVRSMVFTDPALITCVGNDLSYEDVYAEPLSWHLRPGDMAVLVSSSGNSPNVVKAARTAREHGGTVVTLSAMGAGNALRSLGDLNIYLPAGTYGQAETGHAAVLHHWVDCVARLRPRG